MRNHLGFIALSLLAAAFAGCSSADKDPTASSSGGGDLTGELAKYNSAIVPLATGACTWAGDSGSKTTGTATITLAAGDIAVLSLRSVDSALMINGLPCVNSTTTGAIVSTGMLKALAVNGNASGDETIIFDYRNGIFGKTATTVDLKGGTGDELAVLGSAKADKIICSRPTTDVLDVDGDGKADITPTNVAKFTFDLNDGDDTFDQGDCRTKMSIYGNTGKDTITVGTYALTTGDVYSGGTEASGSTTAKADTITFANRTAGVTVTLNGTADDGATAETDNVMDDFEVVTGTKYADSITSGTTQASYTLNGGDGDDVLASKVDHGAAFNGGNGIDTVDYHARAAGAGSVGVTVTMDGAKADDGYRSADTFTYDNVAKDIENIIGTDFADKITGNSLNNVITPGGGADIVFGGDGDDRMVSGLVNDGTSNDKLDGNDVFSGGVGADTVDYSNRVDSATQGVTVVLDNVIAADGTVGTGGHTSGTTTSGDTDSIGIDVENIYGTIGVDHLTGSDDVNAIYGMGEKDIVDGKAGNDQIDVNNYQDSGGNDCNPQLLTCLDMAASGCACTGTLTISCTESSAAAITCGGDPMDIVSCDSTVLAFANCWKIQS